MPECQQTNQDKPELASASNSGRLEGDVLNCHTCHLLCSFSIPIFVLNRSVSPLQGVLKWLASQQPSQLNRGDVVVKNADVGHLSFTDDLSVLSSSLEVPKVCTEVLDMIQPKSCRNGLTSYILD